MAIKADFHMHSDFSGDSSAPMEQMIRQSISLGLSHICMTEHYDPDYVYLPGEEGMFELNTDSYLYELIKLRKKYENEIWEAKDFILKLGLGEKIVVQKDKAGIPENAISILKDGIELYMPLEDLVDMEEERKRLEEEKTRLESEVARCEKMLSNPGFVNKAPEKKIQEEKDKLEKYKDMLTKVEERLK